MSTHVDCLLQLNFLLSSILAFHGHLLYNYTHSGMHTARMLSIGHYHQLLRMIARFTSRTVQPPWHLAVAIGLKYSLTKMALLSSLLTVQKGQNRTGGQVLTLSFGHWPSATDPRSCSHQEHILLSTFMLVCLFQCVLGFTIKHSGDHSRSI